MVALKRPAIQFIIKIQIDTQTLGDYGVMEPNQPVQRQPEFLALQSQILFIFGYKYY